MTALRHGFWLAFARQPGLRRGMVAKVPDEKVQFAALDKLDDGILALAERLAR